MRTIIFGIIVGITSFLSLKAIGLPIFLSVAGALAIAIWVIIAATPSKPDCTNNKKITQR